MSFHPPSDYARVKLPPSGIGTIQAVSAPTANGAALPLAPVGASGFLLILGPSDSVTLTYTTSSQGAPTSAPAAANCVTFTGAGSGTSDIEVPQYLSSDLTAYVVAAAGSPRMRWM